MNCSSRKSRQKKNKITNQTEIGVIRKKIYQYYVDEKESPTVSTLQEILKKDGMVYDWDYLEELLHNIAFRYVRCKSPSRRHFLTEKNDLGYRRLKYLKEIREFRAQNRNIYFMHETFMEPPQIARKADHYLKAELPAKIDEKERMVIVHFGGPSGVINGTFTTVKSDSVTGDHFAEINHPRFEKWIRENLKDKLQPVSVIAVSSPFYKSIQKDKMPRDMFVDKRDIQGWLSRHNIEFDETLHKASLLELCSKSHIKPVYVFDEILKVLGHTVLRIPPHHADLNPIEHIWADIKKNIAQNRINALDEKRKIWSKLFSEYAAEWQKWDDLVKKNEDEYYDYIYQLDDIIDDVIGRYEMDTDSDSESCQSYDDQSDSLSE